MPPPATAATASQLDAVKQKARAKAKARAKREKLIIVCPPERHIVRYVSQGNAVLACLLHTCAAEPIGTDSASLTCLSPGVGRGFVYHLEFPSLLKLSLSMRRW
jgi:hypothetical protein